jgi:hypothetical protein
VQSSTVTAAAQQTCAVTSAYRFSLTNIGMEHPREPSGCPGERWLERPPDERH